MKQSTITSGVTADTAASKDQTGDGKKKKSKKKGNVDLLTAEERMNEFMKKFNN